MLFPISCSRFPIHSRTRKPHSLRINAIHYDDSGEGTGYHDTTPGNTGKTLNTDDVDIALSDEGGCCIGWIEKGEWWRFSDVPGEGQIYYVSARVASGSDQGAFRIELNGKEAGRAAFGSTGGSEVWKTIDAGKVTLPEGLSTLRIISDGGDWKFRWIHFHSSRKAARSLRETKPKSGGKKPNPRVLLTMTEQAVNMALELVDEKEITKVDSAGKNGSLHKVLTRKNVLDQLDSASIPIEFITTIVPYKYLQPGFSERMKQGVPHDSNGKIIVNDGYHDELMVENLMRAFSESYPQIASLHSIGKTWQDRDILALKISDNPSLEEDEPALLFVGAHHASELLSTEYVLDIMEYLLEHYDTDERVGQWVDSCEIWCLPLANPDGLHRFFHVCGSGRKNGRDTNRNGKIDERDGIDLNRNYPFRWHTLGEGASKGDPRHWWYRGPEAASEPEVQAIMRFAEKQRFILLLSFHTSATKILVPYTIDEVRNPEPSVAWMIGEEMAELADSGRKDRSYRAVRNLYSVDGTDQDWHYWKYGTLAYIWEGSRHNPPYERDRDNLVEGIRDSWMYLLKRIAEGPTLSGHILDGETGEPLEAAVEISEIKTFEGEVHTSHPDTGRFDRILPSEGTWHLVIRKEGYKAKKLKVKLGTEWKRDLEVRMERED